MSAEDRAFRVVRMSTLFLAVAIAIENDLNLLPHLIGNDRLMFALVLDFVERDDALVVRPSQDVAHL